MLRTAARNRINARLRVGEPHVEWAGARAGMAMLRTAARNRINARLRVGEPHVEWAGARAGMAMLRTAAREKDQRKAACGRTPRRTGGRESRAMPCSAPRPAKRTKIGG